MISKTLFGIAPGGEDVLLYSISNKAGMKADVMNFGAILVNLFVPDADGNLADVNLGYDQFEDYLTNTNFFGASVGPIANRTANASFEIDGVSYQLAVNDGVNNLHTDHALGFQKCVWDVEVDEEANKITFSHDMADGYLGLPGNRHFTISYAVTDDNGLEIKYAADTDKKTIFSPTNHSYFNLKGHDAGSVLDEKLWLNCCSFTEVVKGAIPTGKLIDAKGTPMDFTTAKALGQDIEADFEQIQLCGGIDHNYVSDAPDGQLTKIAVLSDEVAKRTMEVYTDMPGIQVYTGNFIGPHKGKGGADYKARCAVALETQYFPNSANEPTFKRPLLEPGKPFASTTIYKFV